MSNVITEAIKIYAEVQGKDIEESDVKIIDEYYDKIIKGTAICYRTLAESISSYIIKEQLETEFEKALKEIAIAYRVPESYLRTCVTDREELEANAVVLFYLLGPIIKAAEDGNVDGEKAVKCLANLIEAKAILDNCCLTLVGDNEKEVQAENEAIVKFRKFLSKLENTCDSNS